jgi:hypothetical protein
VFPDGVSKKNEKGMPLRSENARKQGEGISG